MTRSRVSETVPTYSAPTRVTLPSWVTLGSSSSFTVADGDTFIELSESIVILSDCLSQRYVAEIVTDPLVRPIQSPDYLSPYTPEAPRCKVNSVLRLPILHPCQWWLASVPVCLLDPLDLPGGQPSVDVGLPYIVIWVVSQELAQLGHELWIHDMGVVIQPHDPFGIDQRFIEHTAHQRVLEDVLRTIEHGYVVTGHVRPHPVSHPGGHLIHPDPDLGELRGNVLFDAEQASLDHIKVVSVQQHADREGYRGRRWDGYRGHKRLDDHRQPNYRVLLLYLRNGAVGPAYGTDRKFDLTAMKLL
jgi:hypothetical protein